MTLRFKLVTLTIENLLWIHSEEVSRVSMCDI
jgi:hypothetical protein